MWMGVGVGLNWISLISKSNKSYWAIYVKSRFILCEVSFGTKQCELGSKQTIQCRDINNDTIGWEDGVRMQPLNSS